MIAAIWFNILLCGGVDYPTKSCSPTITFLPQSQGYQTEKECFDAMKTWDVAKNEKRACWKFDVMETAQ